MNKSVFFFIIFLSSIFSNISYAGPDCAVYDFGNELECNVGTDIVKYFRGDCIKHDKCYRAIGDPRFQCDHLFKKDMGKTCYKKFVKCSGWSCVRNIANTPKYAVCKVRADLAYDAVKTWGEGPFRTGHENAAEHAVKLAREVMAGTCSISIKDSNVFRPWFLKKQERYSQLVKATYIELLGRLPTTAELNSEIYRSTNSANWAYQMIVELADTSGYQTKADIEESKRLAREQAEAEALLIEEQLAAEAEANAIIEARKELAGEQAILLFLGN